MIKVNKHSKYFYNGQYHEGIAITINVCPSLILPAIAEHIKKGLTYYQTVTMQTPEWDSGSAKWVDKALEDEFPF